MNPVNFENALMINDHHRVHPVGSSSNIYSIGELRRHNIPAELAAGMWIVIMTGSPVDRDYVLLKSGTRAYRPNYLGTKRPWWKRIFG